MFIGAVQGAELGSVERPALTIAWGPDPSIGRSVTNAAGVEQGTCANVGECVLGRRHHAKSSLDLTHLSAALAHGAELRPLCEVTAIGRRHHGYRVHYRDHRTGRHHEEGADRLLSVHPLGGAAVRTNIDDGVVEHTGEVFGHPGLYIADGSLLPAAPGIPPSMTLVPP